MLTRNVLSCVNHVVLTKNPLRLTGEGVQLQTCKPGSVRLFNGRFYH
jgi:hypothetical protein